MYHAGTTLSSRVARAARFASIGFGAWERWRNLTVCFCVFSVIGHWLEMGYSTLVRVGLLAGTYDSASQIWADWFTPFCMYGLGAVACILLLAPFKGYLQARMDGIARPLLLSFAVNMLVCTGIELANGLAFNQPLATGALPLWDYGDMPCNFMGQISLQTSLAFGLVSTLMTWGACPLLEKLFARVPHRAMDAVFVVAIAGFGVLAFL